MTKKLSPDLFVQSFGDLPGYVRGNPCPLRGVALCFEDGRARVMVQGPCSDEWVELLSAPTTSEDGLACAIDLTAVPGLAVATADHAVAKGLP